MRNLVFSYHILARLAYVIGIGIALRKQEEHQFFTRQHGIDAGFKRFRRFAALLMYNDGISFFLLCLATRATFEQSGTLLALGWLFIAVGLGTKLWATARLGADAFFWRNFFVTGLVAPNPPGPYRFLKNPMYTVGYLHMYGWAMVLHSFPGIVAAAFAQIAILIFFFVVEKPHFDQLSRD